MSIEVPKAAITSVEWARLEGRRPSIMIEANNGYNLSLTKQVLEETADSDVYWIEEPFHEDLPLFENLQSWMAVHELPTKIADGEVESSRQRPRPRRHRLGAAQLGRALRELRSVPPGRRNQAYRNGRMGRGHRPDAPGFGIALDQQRFGRAVAAGGFSAG